MATPRYEMGRLAAEIVMRVIETGERPADPRIDVGFAIKERESTGRHSQHRLTVMAAT